MLDVLEAIRRPFDDALIIGAMGLAPQGRFGRLLEMETAERLAAPGGFIAAVDAAPLAPQSFDVILAPLALAWANDPVGALVQLRLALKPDGLLLAGLYGPDTLIELRTALLEAESEITGGAALRVAPVADIREAAGLLQRAGFALPAADRDLITVRYAHPLRLLQDLRAMGETAALADRPPPLRRAVLLRAMEIYQDRFALPDGRVQATFELITLTGWAPHANQQQPLKPGSAQSRLADALGVTEQSAGEKAG